MSEHQESLRRRLLELEPLDGPGRAAYEQRLRELFDHKLSRAERWRYLVPACGGLVMAVGLGSLAITEPETTPRFARVVLLGMACIAALWFVLCWRVLRRGSVDLLTDRRRLANTALGVTLLQVGVFAWRAQADPLHAPPVAVALACLVVAAVVFVVQRMQESEARVREELLRLRLNDSRQRGA